MIFCRHGHGELVQEFNSMLYRCQTCSWTLTHGEVLQMGVWLNRRPHPPSPLHPLVRLDAELQALGAE